MHHIKIETRNKVDIDGTLCSGQTFLWNKFYETGNCYSAIINSTPIFIQPISEYEFDIYSDDEVVNGSDFNDFIHNYFTLDIDTNLVFPESFSELYPELWQLLAKYFSVKIIRQDPFETMISFMCAQGIGMHLIRKQVSMLVQNYGEKRSVSFLGREVILHHFPSPERLASADLSALCHCTNNNRLRAKNIIKASQGVAEGRINLDYLCDRQLPLPELRNMLCLNDGIGYKIADCIALFGLGRFDAFPIDTHVQQYLGKWFKSTTALRSLSPRSYLALDSEIRTILNPDLAGYAGHILFHCWRKEIKKLHSF
ncbi:MAG: DNA glycosylase [Chlorobiaceae bacterium]